jgi:hypothetical protein
VCGVNGAAARLRPRAVRTRVADPIPPAFRSHHPLPSRRVRSCAVAAAVGIVSLSLEVNELDKAAALTRLYGHFSWSPSVANQPVGVQRRRAEALWRDCLGGPVGGEHLRRDELRERDVIDGTLFPHNWVGFARGGCAALVDASVGCGAPLAPHKSGSDPVAPFAPMRSLDELRQSDKPESAQRQNASRATIPDR